MGILEIKKEGDRELIPFYSLTVCVGGSVQGSSVPRYVPTAGLSFPFNLEMEILKYDCTFTSHLMGADERPWRITTHTQRKWNPYVGCVVI